MILVCDSGSTKADWILVDKGRVRSSFRTDGLNPVTRTENSLSDVLSSAKKIKQAGRSASTVYFFGSGCGSAEGKKRMMSVLKKYFPAADIQVDNDLMAAAVATCGNKKGIVCILGTGSNCCFFDGKKIQVKNFGLGYVLGDEGSGAWFGKKFLVAYLYDKLPAALAKKFRLSSRMDRKKIIEAVYRKPDANLFLSSFMPFIMSNRKNVFVKKFLAAGIAEFFETNVMSFAERRSHPVHFVGSIASLMEKEIRREGKKRNLRIGRVIPRPMDGLKKYYLT